MAGNKASPGAGNVRARKDDRPSQLIEAVDATPAAKAQVDKPDYTADIERFGVEVYDGRTRLGRLYDDGCMVVAELDDGRDLGSFTNRAAAQDALIRAARLSPRRPLRARR